MLPLFTVIFWPLFCVSLEISSGQAGVGDMSSGACKDTREGHYRRFPMIMEEGSPPQGYGGRLHGGQTWFDLG